jgi:hypothetical protein
MELHQRDSLPTESPVNKTPDEFASGSLNGVRRLFIRIVRWFTQPGYLPAELILFLTGLIITDLVLTLARQPRGYWIYPMLSDYLWFFNIPLSLGPWVLLGICGVYILILSLLLTLMNSKPAFILWLVLSILHMQNLSTNFACYRDPSYPFINLGTCDGWLSVILLVEALAFGFMLFAAARLGAIPMLSDSVTAMRDGRMKWGATVWIAAALAAFLWMAFAPQPEWRLIQPQHVPPTRAVASLVYDPKNQKAVLFGGAVISDNIWVDLGDTWEWDGDDWQQLNLSNAPSPRRSAAMVYDEKHAVTLLFGGGFADPSGNMVTLNDMWIWDGKNWTQITPMSQPSARMKATIYYDPEQEKVYLYGGYSYDLTKQENIFYNDAWVWDGNTWAVVTLVNPKYVFSGNMLYDRKQQIALMVDNDGIWSSLNQEWYLPNFSEVPIGRSESQLAYDSVHQQTILFGGYRDQNKFNDTWAFDGTQWNKVLTRETPSKRTGHNLFFDSLHGNIILFGGLDGEVTLNDMWELKQP